MASPAWRCRRLVSLLASNCGAPRIPRSQGGRVPAQRAESGAASHAPWPAILAQVTIRTPTRASRRAADRQHEHARCRPRPRTKHTGSAGIPGSAVALPSVSGRLMRGAVRGCGDPGRWNATSLRSARRDELVLELRRVELVARRERGERARLCRARAARVAATSDRPLRGAATSSSPSIGAAPDGIGFVVHVAIPVLVRASARCAAHLMRKSHPTSHGTPNAMHMPIAFLPSAATALFARAASATRRR